MLLKIYTDRNSLVVIENIEDIEIHNGTFYADSILDARSLSGFGPEWKHDGPTPYFEYHDTGTLPDLVLSKGTPGLPLKFIEYRKAGDVWHRLAIGFHGTAYLCNDQGKTIERILEPGRAAA